MDDFEPDDFEDEGPYYHDRKIVLDGIEYHCDEYGVPYTDQDGDMIPSTKCICSAYEPSECWCGAWDDVVW